MKKMGIRNDFEDIKNDEPEGIEKEDAMGFLTQFPQGFGPPILPEYICLKNLSLPTS